MPKTLNCKSAQKLLEKFGWARTAGGKHGIKMEKEGCRPITLPTHKGRDYGKDLATGILKQAEINY